MTAYDNWLAQGSEHPERDEDAFVAALDDVADALFINDRGGEIVGTLYDSYEAIQAVFSGMCLGQHSDAFIALSGLVSDVRARVDDEYKIRTTTYNDPRDE